MRQEVSQEHGYLSAKNVGSFVAGRDYSLDQMDAVLQKVGIGFSRGVVDGLLENYGMDSIQQPVTVPSIATPIQFLQNWLPGFVGVVTAARKIDDLIGISTVGAWEDEQIVQQLLELTGSPVPYGDNTVIPLTNWNLNFITRTVVRFEQGMRVGNLEQARAARVRISSDAQKRASCGTQLEITRNAIGFYGYNSGNNLTYGFLTDPNLPNYITVATGATSGSKLWANKTFQEIKNDLLTGLQQLRTQSQDTIDPKKAPITLAVSTDAVDFLSQTTDFGISVQDWLSKTYPNVRVESAPQLNQSNSGANVFYLYADSVEDGISTDDKRTFIQVVPARFMLLGVGKMPKGYDEGYSNATAGVMVKRPYAITRYTGI